MPCPRCGSTRRNIAVTLQAAQLTITGGPVEVKVIDYPRLLLKEAADVIGRGQFGIAVVVAHMACEVAMSRRLLKFGGGSVDDYATFSTSTTKPSC